MPKNFLQEMIKAKQPQIGGVPEVQPKELPAPLRQDAGQIKTEHKSKRKYFIWILALVSAVFFLFALSYFFSKAVVTVSPRAQDAVLNENLSANKDSTTDILPFDLVVISGEENTNITANEEKDVAEKATGAVIIYNTFSSSSQALDIDTRLEGSNGKIYKTVKRIVVPGMTKDSKPGSVEVKVYGAEAGADYNSAPLDFKIFGFRGTPKYTKFYARSQGDITGGLKGKFPVISDSQKVSAENELKNTLKAKLLKKATDQIPAGFILFKDAAFLDGTSNIDYTSAKDKVLHVKFQGTLYGLLFNEQKLSKRIAENNVAGYDGSEIFIPNIRDLAFSLSNKDSISFADVKNINLNLSGAVKIVWKVDVDKLANDLLGKSKKEFNTVLLQYTNIDSADLVLSPVWRRSMPNKTKDLKIIVNYPK